ncbi:hypothetical protein [Crossiella cryophila]|uniref:Uncharacterized protein n=1 Tax=Crossiella cryophila TaxID=43355 RepID=A0A7W7CFI0_9PSEU|nr:hypothetical protein [Crossiella cryophila]MBB4680246.1 hypothetical protein [Crossiella cryophila]
MSTEFPRTSALLNAVELANSAPSPGRRRWQWRVGESALHLHAETNLIGCGAGLHYAQISLAAQGWSTLVTRFPDPLAPNRLATVEALDQREPTTDAVVLATAALTRLTARDGDTRAMSPALLHGLVAVAGGFGVALHALTEPGAGPDTLLALTTVNPDRRAARLATGEAVAAVLLAAETSGVRAELLGSGRVMWRARELLARAMALGAGTPQAVLRAAP